MHDAPDAGNSNHTPTMPRSSIAVSQASNSAQEVALLSTVAVLPAPKIDARHVAVSAACMWSAPLHSPGSACPCLPGHVYGLGRACLP